VIGWENIELISDRKFSIWIEEFKKIKGRASRGHPDRVDHGGILEGRVGGDRRALPGRGVDAFECNFSCPHGLPSGRWARRWARCRRFSRSLRLGDERGEEAGLGEDDAERDAHSGSEPRVVARWLPGLAAINTIRSVMGVNLETLRPEPTVEGFTTPGGYSCRAVKPIALRMVMEIATMIRSEFPGRSLSGIGGVETGRDAAEFILLGSTRCRFAPAS
jgi:dihydropyrimidine dehydrogenase (NADP+)/dihydropyrimidine dehydrogenase (NAD+) subunit PreA